MEYDHRFPLPPFSSGESIRGEGAARRAGPVKPLRWFHQPNWDVDNNLSNYSKTNKWTPRCKLGFELSKDCDHLSKGSLKRFKTFSKNLMNYTLNRRTFFPGGANSSPPLRTLKKSAWASSTGGLKTQLMSDLEKKITHLGGGPRELLLVGGGALVGEPAPGLRVLNGRRRRGTVGGCDGGMPVTRDEHYENYVSGRQNMRQGAMTVARGWQCRVFSRKKLKNITKYLKIKQNVDDKNWNCNFIINNTFQNNEARKIWKTWMFWSGEYFFT